MLSCEATEILIADAIYQDNSDDIPEVLTQHLESCADCRKLFDELLQARKLIESAGLEHSLFDDIPERAALDTLHERLLPGLDKTDAQRFRELPAAHSARWYMAVGALAASFVIFMTGFVFISSNPTDTTNTVIAQQVNPELMNYLNRAEVMLMQVANTDSVNRSALPIQRTIARDMALEANLLNEVDQGSFASGERKLLRDIEFMLLQIANLDDSNMEEGVALLQRFLEENGVLFKIRLMEMRDNDLVI